MTTYLIFLGVILALSFGVLLFCVSMARDGHEDGRGFHDDVGAEHSAERMAPAYLVDGHKNKITSGIRLGLPLS